MRVSIRNLRAAGLSAEQIVGLLEREENERLERDRARKKTQPPVPISEVSTEAMEAMEATETDSALSLKKDSYLESKKEKKERECGKRLPPDWHPSPTDLAYTAELGMPEAAAAFEAEKFRDYWVAKAGASAVKLDWPATWRNWVRRVCESKGYSATAGPAEIVDEGKFRELREKYEAKRARME